MNKKIVKKNKKKLVSGYTLIEMLFYIILFSILSTVVINSMIIMMKSFKEVIIQKEIVQGGGIIERISREIKQAYQINNIDSPNDLKLDIKVDEITNKIVEFSLVNSNIQLKENDVYTGDLNSPNIEVENLTFTEISTAKGKAIKVFLTIKSKNDVLERNYDFYDTLILRGSY